MSIRYKSGIVFGWKVTPEEKEMMNEISNYEYEDKFIGLDYYDEDDCIFGVWVQTIDFESNNCIEINVVSLANKIPNDFLSESCAQLRDMGCGEWMDDSNHPRHFPKMYMIGQVS